MRMMTVLMPNAKRDPVSRQFSINQYRAVPVIEVHGTWPVVDLLHPETRADLARLTNQLEKADRNRAALARGETRY